MLRAKTEADWARPSLMTAVTHLSRVRPDSVKAGREGSVPSGARYVLLARYLAPDVIRDYLNDYVKTLTPPSLSVTTVAERKRWVKEALEAADVGVVSTFEAGSFSHGTGVKDRSDVDLMVWTSFKDRTQLPSSILSLYRRALFMSTHVANATVSNPAVKVEFWSAPVFEVVPAFYEADDIYEIGGRKDEWVLSSPKAHNSYVNKENDRLGKKVKPLVRLVKAWKYYADVPVSSFYLEMRTAEHCSGEKSVPRGDVG